jgi:hypothetical protein
MPFVNRGEMNKVFLTVKGEGHLGEYGFERAFPGEQFSGGVGREGEFSETA